MFLCVCVRTSRYPRRELPSYVWCANPSYRISITILSTPMHFSYARSSVNQSEQEKKRVTVHEFLSSRTWSRSPRAEKQLRSSVTTRASLRVKLSREDNSRCTLSRLRYRATARKRTWKIIFIGTGWSKIDVCRPRGRAVVARRLLNNDDSLCHRRTYT